jgi:hypothetical protein
MELEQEQRLCEVRVALLHLACLEQHPLDRVPNLGKLYHPRLLVLRDHLVVYPRQLVHLVVDEMEWKLRGDQLKHVGLQVPRFVDVEKVLPLLFVK